MAWVKSTATSHEEALEHLHDFITKTTKAGTPAAGANTGNGTVYGQSSTASSVAETITLTCTTGGASAVFSVTGSVSGALPSANINTLYSESVISFFIAGGSVDFVVSDSFTIAVTNETAVWTAERYDNTPGSDYELIASSAGYTTTDDIYVGLQTYDTGSLYGFRVNGFSGYNAGAPFLEQPGAVAGDAYPWDHHFVPTTDSALTYWFFMSPNRIMGTFLSGAVYSSFYTGWLVPYASPSQWNYPMCVGSCSYTQRAYTDTDADHATFWNSPTGADSATISILDSTSWKPLNQDSLAGGPWPWRGGDIENLPVYIAGNVPTFPSMAIVYQAGAAGVYGEFEGVRAHSTLSGTITTEDTLSSSDYGAGIVLQDTFKAGRQALYILQEDV